MKKKKEQPEEMSRKDRRKEQRTLKKQKKNVSAAVGTASSSKKTAPAPTALAALAARNESKTAIGGKRSRRPDDDDNGTPNNETEARPTKRKVGATREKESTTGGSTSSSSSSGDPYAHMASDVAAALRRDDEEIADLERKLGVGSSKKEKSRLNREYARLECYGDDFGDFLDDIDDMVVRVKNGTAGVGAGLGGEEDDMDDSEADDHRALLDEVSESDSESSAGEDTVPMKPPADGNNMEYASESDDMDHDSDQDEEDSEVDSGEDENIEALAADDADDNVRDGESNENGESGASDSENDEDQEEPDHDASLTYVPSQGQDIYGRAVSAENEAPTTKYVPPHLRQKQGERQDTTDDAVRQESLRTIQRSINSALNRLSEDTLISVTSTLAKLYASYPTTDVHECLWENTRNACVERSHLMSGLIPVYVAALAGVHIEKGDASQLGEYLLEHTVLGLLKQLKTARSVSATTSQDESDPIVRKDTMDKEVCNHILILCYLYVYGVVHCSLMYDIVRDLIDSFAEIDVELLLLVLSHCGRTLRSDDPSALKDIVLQVQKRAAEKMGAAAAYSSRIEYMISAINDLKNNKRRKQDTMYADKSAKTRKLLGRIKSNVAAGKSGSRSSDSSLRISLDDIQNAETKGRWWKVGASWAGSQHSYSDGNVDEKNSPGNSKARRSKESSAGSAEEEKLLKLAAKYRMNTDIRRSIFCIIMGSADCDDSFEKLVRGGMLKNRAERETARVLMECCGNEKSYNKFYSFLATRIIDYQQKCKFTFQLAFWDIFKQFEDLKVRKAANLAKLLFHLVVEHQALKLSVLKAIDMSSPEEMPESTVIFLTIFLSSILERFDDPSEVTQLFESGISSRKSDAEAEEGQDDQLDQMDDSEALRASLTVFLMQVLKASPKYKKGSKYKANLKAAVKACDTENFY